MMRVMNAELTELKLEMRAGFTQAKEDLKEMVEVILADMDKGFQLMNGRMDNFEARLIPIEQNIRSIDATVTEMRLELNANMAATDSHALQLIDHTKRIGRLEKRAA
jgi:hypothetical protein